jgi:hypothetical protein
VKATGETMRDGSDYLEVPCERAAGRPLRNWGRLRWMPGSPVVAGLVANRRVIRKGASSINNCGFRPDGIMCGLLLVLIIDCQSRRVSEAM